MNTVNYNDAEQLFGAVGTSLKKHTAEIADIVNVYGAKNLLENALSSGTSQSVTYTVNANKSISFSGTAAATFTICVGAINVKQGKSYTLSGGYSNNVHLDLRVAASSSSTIWNNNTESKPVVSPQESGALLTFTANADETVYVHFRVGNGTNTSGAVLYPMIRFASIEDNTYVPYAKTNQQLTKDTTALLDNTKENGCVNILNPNVLSTSVHRGITYTVNSDKTVTMSGTNNSGNNSTLGIASKIKLPKGIPLRLTGVPLVTSNYFLYVNAGNNGSFVRVIGNTVNKNYFDFILDYSDYDAVDIGIVVYNNISLANPVLLKPMISLASHDLSYDDYVQYAKSNKELTDDISSLAARIKAIEDTNHLTWG